MIMSEQLAECLVKMCMNIRSIQDKRFSYIWEDWIKACISSTHVLSRPNANINCQRWFYYYKMISNFIKSMAKTKIKAINISVKKKKYPVTSLQVCKFSNLAVYS